MYEQSKEKKMELIDEICKKLNDKGFNDTTTFGNTIEFSTEDGTGRGLMFLPIENLVKLRDCEIDKYNTIVDIYQAWGRCGALKFTPYEVDSRNNPSLVLRHDRFLHMFRGYSFQASGTVDGISDCGSGSYRTDFITRTSHFDRVLSRGLISYMLWWAALIDVGFRFDNFVEAFNKDITPIEKFLNDCTHYWNGSYNYMWADVERNITIGTGHIDTKERKMYQLNDAGVIAYLAIGKKSVQVETADNVLVTITIPNLNEGSGYDLTDEDDLYDFEREVEILESNHYLEMIAVMALKLAGIHISFINYYPLRKHVVTMRPINAPDVVNVKSLNDIYRCTPDEF